MSLTFQRFAYVILCLVGSWSGAQTPFRASSTDQGITVELEIEQVTPGRTSAPFQEGDTLTVRYRLLDQTSAAPLANLKPASWLSLNTEQELASVDPKGAGADLCARKAKAFLSGTLFAKPERDLNAFFVVALNADATLSVVDPLFGFGGSRLLQLIQLDSPGDDWLLDPSEKFLYVSLPDAGKLVEINTETWQVTRHIAIPGRPQRMVLQDDQAALWVASSQSPRSGVYRVDLKQPETPVFVETGAGFHDLVIDRDARTLFVSNHGAGTVSLIDLKPPFKRSDVAVGPNPVSLSYSAHAQAVLVADHKEGQLTQIDVLSGKVNGHAKTQPGLSQVRFTPQGRFALALNSSTNTLHIYDASSRRLLQSGSVEEAPSQIAFSDQLAYILHERSETVLMVPLGEIGTEGKPIPLADFPGGRLLPHALASQTALTALVQVPVESAVVLPDSENRAIHYYSEGMAAPMGSYKNYGHVPRGLKIIDRSLQERKAAGTYETTVQLQKPGAYDAVFFLDSPRVVACFPFTVAVDPVKEQARRQAHKQVRFADGPRSVVAGTPTEVVFELSDDAGQGIQGLTDIEIVFMAAGGVWSQHGQVRELDKGRYVSQFTPPRPGHYSIYVGCASQGVSMAGVQARYIKAVAAAETSPSGGAP